MSSSQTWRYRVFGVRRVVNHLDVVCDGRLAWLVSVENQVESDDRAAAHCDHAFVQRQPELLRHRRRAVKQLRPSVFVVRHAFRADTAHTDETALRQKTP